MGWGVNNAIPTTNTSTPGVTKLHLTKNKNIRKLIFNKNQKGLKHITHHRKVQQVIKKIQN